MGLGLNEALKSLCCSNGWCHAIFWRFDERNSMLLTAEDAYYEEEMETVVNKMMQQVHMLGEGIIGQAASTGSHHWIFSDADGSVGSQNQDDSSIHNHFSSGIKTVAVISVDSRGVIEFGSTKKILEEGGFLDQAKKVFTEMENVNRLTFKDSPSSSLNCESYDLNEWFDSLCNGNITPIGCGSRNELMDVAYATISSQLSAFTSDVQQDTVNTSHMDSSQLINHLQPASNEAQVTLSSNSYTQLQQLSSQSAPALVKSISKIPWSSTRSNGGSVLNSIESQFQPEMRSQDSPDAFSMIENTSLSCKNTEIFQLDSTASSCGAGGFVDAGRVIQEASEKSMSKQHLPLLVHANGGGHPESECCLDRLLGEFKSGDLTTNLSNSDRVDCFLEWFSPSSVPSICETKTILNNNIPQFKRVTSASSGLIGDILLDIPFEEPTTSLQSSITDAYAWSGSQKSAVANSAEKDLFEGLGVSLQAGSRWQDMMTTGLSTGDMAVSTFVSECVSELDAGSSVAPRRGLFSELGLEELLDGISNSNYSMKFSTDDQLSNTKRRKVEGSSVISNQDQSANFSYSSGCTKMEHEYNLEKRDTRIPKTEVFHKSQVSLWIDDSYSASNGNTAVSKSKKPELPVKTTKKRAKPGESTRPRPKDRQQIQDRLKELREIIPDGGKCSIDALLDFTIKHMVFLQNVTKYADKLKQADESKLIGQGNRMNQNGNDMGSGGKTWALEVRDETMVCPIIVEDLSPPGLMFIEMLCEDRGFFLEIADVIKGFGLNILKGVMETREDKIWARFIVEANMHVTRMDIFWSLAQLLDRTGTSAFESMNQPVNAVSSGIPLLSNYQMSTLPCPISLANTLQ